MAAYYKDETRKNLVSQLKHTDIELSELRIKVKSYYIHLNERFKKYEPIKEQFKRYQNITKIQERGSAGAGLPDKQALGTIHKTIEL